MAVATASIIVSAYPAGISNDSRMEMVRGTIKVTTGGTYPPGGFPLSWANTEGVKAIPASSTTPSSTGSILPVNMDIKSGGNPPSGYSYVWNSVNGNMHIFESNNGVSGNSGPLVEVGGAIANAIVADTILFRAEFVRE